MPKNKWMSLVAICLFGTSANFSMGEEPQAVDQVFQAGEQDLVSELNEDSPVVLQIDEYSPIQQASAASHVGGQLFQTYSGDLYKSFTAVEYKAGTDRSLGDLQLVVPLWQDTETLIFADLRGRIDDSQSKEGNWGLGWRQIQDNTWIIGAYAFYDLRKTENDNNFSQATVGLEALSVEWEARVNGYIPETKSELANSLNVAQIQNGMVVFRAGEE